MMKKSMFNDYQYGEVDYDAIDFVLEAFDTYLDNTHKTVKVKVGRREIDTYTVSSLLRGAEPHDYMLALVEWARHIEDGSGFIEVVDAYYDTIKDMIYRGD